MTKLNKFIIFDLDDTLYYEIDFLKSAYNEISILLDNINREELYNRMLFLFYSGKNVFNYLTDRYSVTLDQLLFLYRNHKPNIVLNEGGIEIINKAKSLNYKLGLITDGYSITQRNKLKALEIENYFDKIIISEEFGSTKPNENNYKAFVTEGIYEFFYIGDNTKKDFITPNKLGWTTICLLDNGVNIHKQDNNLPVQYLPQNYINNLKEILDLIIK
ncbi:HAD family hydrolase [Faecalibacter bovis]|uniref:HAD family hydrolase n=1 Tax=Faecalibacter bovis TaxID=2898187 RepID=A0ABX7XFA9_9FLAO|nr:HAD family hydrolase [Faecalibacter bovis]QTV06618.1 HAD family hydrolase [Faecalibacter bovis]